MESRLEALLGFRQPFPHRRGQAQTAPRDLPSSDVAVTTQRMGIVTLGIEKMLDLAFRYGLIRDYRLSPKRIEIATSRGTLKLGPEEARFFLYGLLCGYEQTTPVRPG